MMYKRVVLFVMLAVSLAACHNEKNRNILDQRTDQAIRMGEVAQAPGPAKSYDPLVVLDEVWAGNSAVKLSTGLPLPRRVEGPRGVTLISSEDMTLEELAAALSAQTGVPVRVDDFSLSNRGASSRKGASGGDKMMVAYEGPLSGLLTRIAGNFGLIWRYNGTSVELSRYITRVFTVQALPGELSIKDGVGDVQDSGSSSSSSSSGGGSYSASSSSSLKQSSEMEVEMKVWDELAATVRAIIGSDGKAVISPSSGTVTVTATPSVMETVATFIREENERLSHQIAINVEIYSVTIEDTDNVDVSLSTAFARLGDLKFNVASATGTASEAVQGTMGTMSLAILNGGAERVCSVFKALSYVGDTTRVAQFPLTTLNNRPVARRIGRDRTYVASISNDSSTESSYSSSTVEPGTIREGFSLQLTPRLLDDGRIMMQYSLSLTDIVDISTFDTGSAGTIELPETSSRVFVQQTMLRSGSTLVIGGYDDEKTTQSSQGVGSPYNYFLGGGSTNSKSRSMLFIAITPQVLDVLPTEQL